MTDKDMHKITEAESTERQAFECELDADPAPMSNINSLIRMGRIQRFEEQMAKKYGSLPHSPI
jgi:hypothetical protein